jgi:hypothetical protein
MYLQGEIGRLFAIRYKYEQERINTIGHRTDSGKQSKKVQ